MGFEIFADGIGKRIVAHVLVEVFNFGGVEPHRGLWGPGKARMLPVKVLAMLFK